MQFLLKVIWMQCKLEMSPFFTNLTQFLEKGTILKAKKAAVQLSFIEIDVLV